MNSPFVVRASGSSSPAFDPDEARHALRLLVDPDARHELRGLPSGRSRLVSGSDPDAALAAATALADDRGVYYTLNPVRPDLGDRGAKNADVLRRVWLLVDVDPVRTDAATGEPVRDVSSTAEEKASAWFVTQAARAGLAADGWPAPVVVDSGNGFHLLYRVDLPNDKLAAQWVAGCLRALARRHDTARATVDTKVHNAARIAKLPGTWSRKGPSTEERPHRMCCLASVPDAITPTPDALVRDLAGLTGAPEPPAAELPPIDFSAWTLTATTGQAAAYARAALEGEAGKVAGSRDGRNNQLYESALKLGGLVAAGALDEREVRGRLAEAARRAGLPDPGDPAEIERAVANALAVGMQAPRAIPAGHAGPAAARAVADTAGYATPGQGESITIRACDIVPRRVEWLWPDRIPIGKLTTFAGWGGLGKSFVTMDLASRISRGDEVPGLAGECFEAGNVLILNTEDDPDDTSVPRLIEAGADLERVRFFRSQHLARFTLADLQVLDRALAEMGGARLLVIDPATSHLGPVNDHKNAELKALLSPLSLWAQERRVAVVLVTHVNKPQAGKVEAMARVVGGVAWVNSVRAAVMFARDPDDKGKRLFIPFKSNNAPERRGMSYRVVPTDTLARVEWLGEVETTADEAMNHQAEKKPAREVVASDWLTDRFREKREWFSDDLFSQGQQDGVSRNAIFKAKELLDLPRARQEVIDGSRVFVWWVPPDWGPLRNGTEKTRGTVNQWDSVNGGPY